MNQVFETMIYAINWLFWLLRVLANFIFPPINKIEKEIIATIRDKLKDEYIEIFDHQIGAVNVFRRFDVGDISLCFCHWSLFHLEFKYTGKYFFDQKKEHEKLVYFDIKLDNDNFINCTLNATNGVISHINMHQPKILYSQLFKGKYKIIVKKGKIVKK